MNILHDIKAPIFRTSYLIGCGFNSLAMMSACCLLFILLSLTTFWFLAQHHILTLVFLMAVIMVIGVFVRVCMCLIGIQVNSVDTINVYPRKRSLQSVTEKIGEKQNIIYYIIYFCVNDIGGIISCITINIFLPPSNVTIHPFEKVGFTLCFRLQCCKCYFFVICSILYFFRHFQ